MIALIAILTFVVSAGTVHYLLRYDSRLLVVDIPNARSLHSAAIARGGGLGICTAIIVGCGAVAVLYEYSEMLPWTLLGMCLIAVISYVDDRVHVSVVMRLFCHMVAASLIVMAQIVPPKLSFLGFDWAWSAAMATGLCMLFVVWLVNLFNFMDGMDGFAGGMGMIGFAAYAMLGQVEGHEQFFAVCVVLSAACAGFLLFNFPPAKVFMGDVGSLPLGYMVAATTLWAVDAGIFGVWIGLLVFSPFIVDASVTLVRRLLNQENIFKAHRTHYYQRLVRLGFGHRRTVIMEYIVMIVGAGTAIAVVGLSHTTQWLTMAVWMLLYIGAALKIARLERKSSSGTYSNVP